MSKGIELGLGIEADQAAQVRFELRHVGLSVLIMAVHSGERHRAQTIARMRPISDDRIGLELMPIRSPMLAHAFNCNLGQSLPITLQGERAQEWRQNERFARLIVAARAAWQGWNKGDNVAGPMYDLRDVLQALNDFAPLPDKPVDLGDNPARIGGGNPCE